MSAAVQATLSPDFAPEADCPDCATPIAPRLALAVESMQVAAKRPATPEVLHVCAGCGKLFVISLQPIREPVS